MLRVELIRNAVEDITTAALLGHGWEEALNRFAYASGAHGAVLMRNRADRMLTAITTEEVAEAVSAFAAGRAPQSSRYRQVAVGLRLGFRVDHDDYAEEQLARDPFYQEFLRPIGFFWHANVALTSGRNEWVELSLKRRFLAGPYERQDAIALDAVLPDLRAAAHLASRTLDAEAHGMAKLLRGRGDPLYQLDAQGRVLSTEAIEMTGAGRPICVLGRKLVAADRSLQPGLDRAVAMAVGGPRITTLAPLSPGNARRQFMQIVPIPGRARDIFLSAAAIAVLIDLGSVRSYARLDASTIGHALALTDREADVAALLAEGMSLVDIARKLRLQVATTRVHLRNIFEKTGTRRQAELVALLGRLRP
jgi:DNA-binding CsgD family transcriptional regulator